MRTNRADLRRALRAATVVAAVGLLSGCSDWLEVTNPGAVENPALEGEEYISLMVAGVLGDFQPAYAWSSLFGAGFTDELRIHHSYFENFEIDERNVGRGNGTYALSVFNGLHRARFLADSVGGRLTTMLADSASRDARLALVRGLGGYGWLLLGEVMCESRINGEGAPLTPAELMAGSLPRFEEAIAVAQAARAAAASAPEEDRDSLIADADGLINMARVGAARAALGMAAYGNEGANLQLAIDYATAVEPAYVDPADEGFVYWTHHTLPAGASLDRRLGNPYHEFITAGRWFSVTGTRYEALNDPRVPTFVDWITGGGTADIPNAPPSFSVYDGTPEGAEFTGTTSIRLASALEARYILAEAQGLTPANLAFVNERASIGGMDLLPATATEAEYEAALREQRRRDFYLDGHRLGDLRRYEAMYGLDLWETGAMYGSETRTFGDQKCWPTPLSEDN